MASADGAAPPTAEWIRHHWDQARAAGPGTLLVLDEIQKIPGWSETVKVLFDADRDRTDLRILLLGSSSLNLQRGLSDSLAGRFELLEAPHWTFGECANAFGWDFDTYLRYGAYPGAARYAGDDERWRTYIRSSIIEPVLGRDILGQHPMNKPALFRQTFELAVQHPAQIVSAQKMLGQLQDHGNITTIQHYLELCDRAFLLRRLQKFSGSIVQSRGSIPKIIVLNPALTHAYQLQARLDDDPQWYGYMFESAVGAHLAQIPNAQLYYWRDGRDEVDFVVRTPHGTWAIEVKAGARIRSSRGLFAFSRCHPEVRCLAWTHDDCLRFMQGTVRLEG